MYLYTVVNDPDVQLTAFTHWMSKSLMTKSSRKAPGCQGHIWHVIVTYTYTEAGAVDTVHGEGRGNRALTISRTLHTTPDQQSSRDYYININKFVSHILLGDIKLGQEILFLKSNKRKLQSIFSLQIIIVFNKRFLISITFTK